MNAFASRAVNAYASVGVETGVAAASPAQLIVLLYQGAMAAVAAAQRHLRQNNIGARGQAISKAISIINDGLKASLDLNVGGPMAQSLSDLYAYMGQRLLEANLHNDGQKLDEVAQLLQQLGNAWESIAAKPAPPSTPTAPPESAPAPVVSMQSRRLASAYGAF